MRRPSSDRRLRRRLERDRPEWDARALLESTRIPFTVASYRPRAVIFTQGDPADSVLYIDQGRVWLGVAASSGQEGIVGVLGPGAFLGEEALGGHGVRQQTAVAMTDTEILVIAKGQMIQLLRTQPAASDRFVAHVVARSIRLQANLTDQLLHVAEQRLARALLMLAGCDRPGSYRGVLPDVSQETIAEMVGTTRSRVNSFMGKFKKIGFIEEEHGVLLVNPAFLHAVHDNRLGASTDRAPSLSHSVRR